LVKRKLAIDGGRSRIPPLADDDTFAKCVLSSLRRVRDGAVTLMPSTAASGADGEPWTGGRDRDGDQASSNVVHSSSSRSSAAMRGGRWATFSGSLAYPLDSPHDEGKHS
jgi:hypothetical protein